MIARMAVLLVLMLFSSQVQAERFRCGQSLVSEDSTVAELLEKCGEPTTKSVRHEDIYAKAAAGGVNRIGVATIETWTYERGSQLFPMIVTIVDGQIRSVERGS